MPSSLPGKERRTYDIPGSHRFWCYPFAAPSTAWILPLCRCRHTYLMVNGGSLGCNKQKTSYPRSWLELQSKNTENAHPSASASPPQICQSESVSAFPTEEPCGLCHKPHGAKAGGIHCLPVSRTADIYLLLPDPSTVPSELSSHVLSQSSPLSLALDRAPVRPLRRRKRWREGWRLQELEKFQDQEEKARDTGGEWKVLQRTVSDALSLRFVPLISARYTRHVEVKCPPKKNIPLILGIVIAVIGGNYLRPPSIRELKSISKQRS